MYCMFSCIRRPKKSANDETEIDKLLGSNDDCSNFEGIKCLKGLNCYLNNNVYCSMLKCYCISFD